MKITLSKLMKKQASVYTADQVIQKCGHLFNDVKSMHDAGKAHGGICPDNLYLCGDGSFLEGKPRKRIKIKRSVRPYLSPEYKNGDKPTAAGDVYALGAVLYYMLTGQQLPDALKRQENDELLKEALGSIVPNEALINAVLKAVNLDVSQRFPNAGEFMRVLEIGEQPSLTVKERRRLLRVRKAPKEMNQKRKELKLISLIAGIVIIAAILVELVNGGLFLKSYSYAKQWKFGNAVEVWNGYVSMPIPADNKFTSYLEAGEQMENGDYYNSRKTFKQLEDYLDSQTLVKECDYRYATKLLQNNADAFTAAKMLKELGDYLDSAEKLEETKSLVYIDAQRYFYGGDDEIYYSKPQYTTAIELFEFLGDYEDSITYVEIATKLKDASDTEDEYAIALSYIDNPIANKLILKQYLELFLKGTWGNGSYSLRLKITSKSTTLYYGIPAYSNKKYWYANTLGVILFYSKTDFSDAVETYQFTIVNKNRIKVYCYKNKRTYTLYRR